jgi:hypothetical protein
LDFIACPPGASRAVSQTISNRLKSCHAALPQGHDTRKEQSVLRAIYELLPSLNFSSDLLARATSNLTAMEMKDVFWCDWGKPERIVETLRRIGKEPSFPTELLRSHKKAATKLSDTTAIRCSTAGAFALDQSESV